MQLVTAGIITGADKVGSCYKQGRIPRIQQMFGTALPNLLLLLLLLLLAIYYTFYLMCLAGCGSSRIRTQGY